MFENVTAEYLLKKIETFSCKGIKITLPSQRKLITSQSVLKNIEIGDNFNLFQHDNL